MTLPYKPRLAKRKLEIKEVRKEKQTATSKKHDKSCFRVEKAGDNDHKSSTKTNDESMENEDLQKQLNDALLEEVKASEKAIANLERKEKKYVAQIKELEQKLEKSKQESSALLQKQKVSENVEAGSQTDDNDIMFCDECEFPADSLFELGEHVGEFHTGLRIPCNFCSDIYTTMKCLRKHEKEVHEEATILNQPEFGDQISREVIKCKFCNDVFKDKCELMKHSREDHKDKIALCWNFQAGYCQYQDQCWFSHEINPTKLNQQYNCNSCEEQFTTQAKLSKHQKTHHKETVPHCTKFTKGICSYDNQTCWFVHNSEEEKNFSENCQKMENEDRILLKNLVDMVEKLMKRVIETDK